MTVHLHPLSTESTLEKKEEKGNQRFEFLSTNEFGIEKAL